MAGGPVRKEQGGFPCRPSPRPSPIRWEGGGLAECRWRSSPGGWIWFSSGLQGSCEQRFDMRRDEVIKAIDRAGPSYVPFTLSTGIKINPMW